MKNLIKNLLKIHFFHPIYPKIVAKIIKIKALVMKPKNRRVLFFMIIKYKKQNKKKKISYFHKKKLKINKIIYNILRNLIWN